MVMKMKIDKELRFNSDEYVKINNRALEKFADFIMKNMKSLPNEPYNWIDNRFWLDPSDGNEINSQFFTIGNAINFKYWKILNSEVIHPEGLKNGVKCKGAYYMWRCLKSCVENNEFPLLNAKYLSKIRMKDIKNIFRTDFNENIIPDLKQRLRNWRDLGRKLEEKYEGKFYNLILKIKNSLNKFILLLKGFRAFDDPLNKLTIVNAIFHIGRNIINFDKPLFPAIDYQLMTQSLRIGLLNPSPKLKYKIENKIFINKTESLALRGATLKSLNIIIDRVKLSGEIIDNIMFQNGRQNCTFNLICQKVSNTCIFEGICEKNVNFYIPLENTRYY